MDSPGGRNCLNGFGVVKNAVKKKSGWMLRKSGFRMRGCLDLSNLTKQDLGFGIECYVMPEMKELHLKVIPHQEQRYETSGDYFTDESGVEQIRVSALSDPKYEHLVMLHELFERIWCFHNGVTNEQVDAFDKLFEQEREEGKHGPDDEPGDDPRAPYCVGHGMATIAEATLGCALGIKSWKEYGDAVRDLSPEYFNKRAALVRQATIRHKTQNVA